MEKVKIKLEYGLEIDGIEVFELEARRPTVHDLKLANSQAKGDDEQASFNLIANLCMITVDQVKDLDIGVDYKTVDQVIHGFINDPELLIDKSKAKNRSVRIDLKHPFTDGSKEITFIDIKRPRVKDFQYSEQGENEVEKNIRMLSRISGLNEAQICKLDYGSDYMHAEGYTKLFLGISQP